MKSSSKTKLVVLGLLCLLLFLTGCSNLGTKPTKYELTIRVSPSNAGTVTPADGSKFAKDTLVELKPVAATGWDFDHWEGPNASEVVKQDNIWKIQMNSDKSLTAVFVLEAPAFSVSLEASPLTGTAPLKVDFTAVAHNAPEGALTYDWDFGDSTVQANGGTTQSHTYQAAGNYTAKVTVKDSKGVSATGQITIPVTTGNNSNPSAVNDAATVKEDEVVDIDVLANDTDQNGDTLSIASVSQASHGSAVIQTGKVHYAPAANYHGTDSFTYTVADGKGGTATGTVTITVEPVNDVPVANADTAQVTDSGYVVVAVLANDTDVDGDSLTIDSFTQGAHGTVTKENNSLRYVPADNFSGNDQFTYVVSDGKGGTATATVTVTSQLGNQPPVAADDTVQVNEDSSVLIDVLKNDTDANGDTLSIQEFTQGGKGSVVKEGNGLRYAPVANFNGSDTFTYVVSDGKGGTASGKVTITINPVNDAPVAVDDVITVDEDSTIEKLVLANDTDLEGDSLVIDSFTQGSHGTVATSNTGLRYTPAANYKGSDSFTYVVKDGKGGTCTGTVNVTVKPVNDAPVAANDTKSVDEDTPTLINVLANDTEVDGDTLTITSVTQGTHGTVVKEGTGVRYTPAANYSGTDSFSYTVQDPSGLTATATVSITINPVNDAPSVTNETVTVDEDSSTLVDVLKNDSDVDGDVLTIASFTPGSHGAVVKDGNGLRYTPAANFSGSDSFTYVVSDGKGGTKTGTVSVTVSPINDAPTAKNDTAGVQEGGTSLVDVIANDTDVDGDSLTITSYTQGAHGTVTQEGNRLRYAATGDYNGQDTFTYTISDGKGKTATATVTINVLATPDTPLANDDSVEVNEDGSVLMDLLKNDTDPEGDTLTITSFNATSHGLVVKDGTSLRYTPLANYNGPDSFTYTISDGHGGSDTATVTITVKAVNDQPEVANDSAELDEDISVLISVLNNDSDIDGDSLTITSVTHGQHGSVVIEANKVRYTPAENYSGADNFSYTMSDGHGGTASAFVNVVVNAVNDAPKANNDSAEVNEDANVLIDVLVNDSDVEEASLTITAFSQGGHGTVAKEDNSLRYTPAANYNGPDSFTYEVSDGKGGTATATVNITVVPVNDVPVAVNDTAQLDEDTTTLIPVLTNDSDIDGDTLTIASVALCSHGSVAIEANQIQYTPAANYAGADSFTYTISDGHDGTATATVTITVLGVNDVPNANNDSAEVNEDGNVLINVVANDSDLEDVTPTIKAITQGGHGTVAKEGNSLRYTPAENYNGPDSFTYEVSDSNGGTAIATVTVTVLPVNDSPVAVNDTVGLNEDSPVLIDVVANDSDIDNDVLTVNVLTQGTHGSVVLEGNSLRYTPNANYNGADSFTYRISDVKGLTATATVTVNVLGVNDPTNVGSDAANVDEDSFVLINVLQNDSDPDGQLNIITFANGVHGAVTLEDVNSLRYTPSANYCGPDSFTYQVIDVYGESTTGTVNVIVNSLNDVPVAKNDTAVTDEDTSTLIAVLTNDTDVDEDSLSILSFTEGTNGKVELDGNSLRYTPKANVYGTDSFTYRVQDGNGGEAVATVEVTINAVNDAPTANPDPVWMPQNDSLPFDVLLNDTDPEGNALTLLNCTNGAHGMATVEGNQVRYTPDENFKGIDTVTYEISDGFGGTATGVLTINVLVSENINIPTYETEWIDVTIASPGIYSFQTSNLVNCDTLMYLWAVPDFAVDPIAYSEEHGGNYFEYFLNPGVYYIIISEWDMKPINCHVEVQMK